MNFALFARTRQRRAEQALRRVLAEAAVPAGVLPEAMRYGVLGGGKRLRPLLAYAGAEALGADLSCADIPACAVELVHSYSLIHDDLPAMDDDALRRGRATCHIVYGEAMAILAGDALQTLAFELLAESQRLAVGHRTRLRMIGLLARAAGGRGMVAGQSLDFSAVGASLDEAALARMHGLKTGALIRASVLLGALSSNIAGEAELRTLERYADCLGLAFQVQDDILDVSGDTRTLGKQQGRDQALNKPTYTSLLGLEGARTKAASLCEEALAALEPFGAAAEGLRELARYVVRRDH